MPYWPSTMNNTNMTDEKLLALISTDDLIAELEKRGYRTDLLFCREDVKMQLELYNETEDTEHELTDAQMDEILGNVEVGTATEDVNNSIFTEIEIHFQNENDGN